MYLIPEVGTPIPFAFTDLKRNERDGKLYAVVQYNTKSGMWQISKSKGMRVFIRNDVLPNHNTLVVESIIATGKGAYAVAQFTPQQEADTRKPATAKS